MLVRCSRWKDNCCPSREECAHYAPHEMGDCQKSDCWFGAHNHLHMDVECVKCAEPENTLSTDDSKAVYNDFCKCDELATKIASLFPDDPALWRGSVSERLNRGVELLRKELGR